MIRLHRKVFFWYSHIDLDNLFLAARPSWRDDEDDEDDDQPSEKRGKRKHSPIVWAAQPKKAPRTAAELMQAELAEFAKARAAAGGDDGQDEDRRLKSPIDKYMKDSPEMSSPEEGMQLLF